MSKVGIMHYSAPPRKIAGVEVVIDYHSRILARNGYNIRLIFGAGGGLNYKPTHTKSAPTAASE